MLNNTLIISFLLIIMGCKERETITFYPEINQFRNYSILERKDYRASPEFDSLQRNNNSLNGSITRGIKFISEKDITSFITLDSLENRNLIVYFSNDTINVSKYLQIITVDKKREIEIHFKGFKVLPADNLIPDMYAYYVPIEQIGLNKVDIVSNDLKVSFKIWGSNHEKADSFEIMNEYNKKISQDSDRIDLDSLFDL